jgi:iron complex outermembrane receptor protein
MIDGVSQSTPLRNGRLGVRTVDASALERIEVVKGASSMYGNGAAGGLINYITMVPESDTELSGDIGISSRFSMVDVDDSISKRVNGTLSGTIGDFSYVLNAVYDARGQQKDADGDTLGLVYGLSDLTTKNLFSKLAYQIDADKQFQLSYNLYDSQQSSDLIDITGNPRTGVKTQAVENNTDRPNLAAPQGPKGNYNVMVKYSDAELLDNTEFNIDAYKQKIENVFFRSTNLANPEQGYDAGQSLILSKKQGLRVNFRSDFNWDSVDTSLIYGIDLLNDVGSQPLIDGRLWVPEMDMDSRAAYLQSKWTIADDWVFKAGVRRESIDIAVEDFSTLRLCRSATRCSVSKSVTGGDLD